MNAKLTTTRSDNHLYPIQNIEESSVLKIRMKRTQCRDVKALNFRKHIIGIAEYSLMN